MIVEITALAIAAFAAYHYRLKVKSQLATDAAYFKQTEAYIAALTSKVETGVVADTKAVVADIKKL